VGTDGVRAAGAGLMRRTGLLAVLFALLATMATTSTTTAPARSAATEAVAAAQQSAAGGVGSADTACEGLDHNGSDTVVRVVKKVRGVFLPHGLVTPAFAPADPLARHEVSPTHPPVPGTCAPTYTYPRRGPPTTGVHPSP
jgi:hypothetical protein